MGGGCLGNFIVLSWLDGVDQVRELDGILNEEDGNVVSNNIWKCLALLCITELLPSYKNSPKLPSSV